MDGHDEVDFPNGRRDHRSGVRRGKTRVKGFQIQDGTPITSTTVTMGSCFFPSPPVRESVKFSFKMVSMTSDDTMVPWFFGVLGVDGAIGRR